MPRHSLSQIIQRGILARMVLPLVVLVALLTFMAALAQKQRAESATMDVVEAVARNVAMYLDDSFLVIEHAARQSGNGQGDPAHLYGHLAEILSIYPKFERLMVIDANRNLIFQIPQAPAGLDFPLELESGNKGRLILSRPLPSKQNGQPVIFIGAPLPDGRTLVAELGLSGLASSINLPSSETVGKILVTDAFGNLVSHPDHRLVDRHVNVGGEPWFTRSAHGQPTVLYEEDGALYLSTAVEVPAFNWKVFGQTRAMRVFSPVLVPVAAFFVILMLFAGLSTILLRREFERRIEHPLRRFVSHLRPFALDEDGDSRSLEGFSELATFEQAFDTLGQRISDRETRLIESERRLMTIFEQAAVGMVLCRLDGSIFRVNQKFSDITGYTRQALSQLDFRSITHPDDLEADENRLGELLAGRIKSYSIEIRYLRPDGAAVWVQLTTSLAKDGSGNPLHLLGVVEDISQRKQAETALGESEKRFRSVFEQVPTGIMLYGKDSRIIEINAAGAGILGLALTDRVEGWELSRLLRGPAELSVRQAVLTGQAVFEGEHLSPFRQTPAVLKMTHLSVSSELFLCLFEDVTASRRAAAAMRESEERYRCVFDEALDMIFLIDAESGIFLDCNKETVNALGFSKSEIVGQHKSVIFPNDVKNSYFDDILGQPGDALFTSANTTRIKSKDGVFIDVAIKASPFTLQGRLVHSAIVRDITALKRDENLLRESLAEKVVMLREIHHRVKNNLQIISSLLYLQSGQAKDPQTQELFKESRDRIASMALVHEELYRSGDFSRVELSGYLKKQVSRLVGALGGKRVESSFDMEEIHLALDRAIPFGLIVNELVTNSIKHAFVGREHGQIHISIHTDQGYVSVAVRDDGVGLPSGFSMTQTSTLGMELVNRLCAQIKATLSAHSDQGAMFSLRFPLEVNKA